MPESLFSKVAGLSPATLLKRDSGTGAFPVNFAKFLRARFLQNTPRRLFLSEPYQTSEIELDNGGRYHI